MKWVGAQIPSQVANPKFNLEAILQAWEWCEAQGADLIVTPELSLNGYPLLDLISRPEVFESSQKNLEHLIEKSRNYTSALLVGHLEKNADPGKPYFNSFSLIEKGNSQLVAQKRLLPCYDVFDDPRHFEEGKKNTGFRFRNLQLAVLICEDAWQSVKINGHRRYGRGSIDSIIHHQPPLDLIFCCSASPYHYQKTLQRQEIFLPLVEKAHCPLFFLNKVGAQDDLLFDGSSFLMNEKGQRLAQMPFFEKSLQVFDLKNGNVAQAQEKPHEMEVLMKGLVLGIQSYFETSGFQKAVLGVSGGIDSSVIAYLLTQALGPENVFAYALPTQYSSSESFEDALLLCQNLKIKFQTLQIQEIFQTFLRTIPLDTTDRLANECKENLQSRIRGVVLMMKAHSQNALVVSTGNKSEFSMGYATLYGDLIGALAPIGDLYKTQVYELADYINRRQKWIPQRCIDKAPTAELRPNQKDQDFLPPYELLDVFLKEFLENNTPIDELEAKFDQNDEWIKLGKTVKQWISHFHGQEFKRKQAPFPLKVSPTAFGSGRRVPLLGFKN